MSEIRVNTGDLRSCSQDLNNSATTLGDAQSRVNSVAASVGNAYDGQFRSALDGIIGADYQTGFGLQSRAFDLGRELYSRATGFDAANEANNSAILNIDNHYNLWSSSSTMLARARLLNSQAYAKASAIFGLAGLGAGWLSARVMTLLSSTWGKALNDVRGVADDAEKLSLITKMPYDSAVTWQSYKGLGRIFNNAVGNQKFGAVGFMDKFGHVINNPITKGTMMVASLGLGIYDDLQHKDSLNRAVGSELAETAIDAALLFTPLVGQVYLGYKIGRASLGVSVGILDVIGQHDNARWLENTLEQTDISEFAGDWIYDRANDFVSHPPDATSVSHLKDQVIAQFGFGMAN